MGPTLALLIVQNEIGNLQMEAIIRIDKSKSDVHGNGKVDYKNQWVPLLPSNYSNLKKPKLQIEMTDNQTYKVMGGSVTGTCIPPLSQCR